MKHQPKRYIGCLFKMSSMILFLLVACLSGCLWNSRSWWFQYLPKWYFYQEDAVYFERYTEGHYYHTLWTKDQGAILGDDGNYQHLLYTVPPGHGLARGRWVSSLPGNMLTTFYSYARGYAEALPCLPGEGRLRWTADGRYLVTSTYVSVADRVEGWLPVGSKIVLFTPNDCHVVRVMVEGKVWRLWDPDLSVRGLLAYARGPWDDDAVPREIVVRDFRNDKTWVIGEGINPTWSSDGEWLAYTGDDGLYVVRWDGSQRRRVLKCTTQESMEDIWGWKGPATWWKWPPRPDWSPDGKWLIYHRREGEEYNIYRLNLATGEEELLIRNGVHPQWRWLRQEVAYPEAWGISDK